MDNKQAKKVLRKFLKDSGYEISQIRPIVEFVVKTLLSNDHVPSLEKETKENCVIAINAKVPFNGTNNGFTQMTELESQKSDERRGSGPRI